MLCFRKAHLHLDNELLRFGKATLRLVKVTLRLKRGLLRCDEVTRRFEQVTPRQSTMASHPELWRQFEPRGSMTGR